MELTGTTIDVRERGGDVVGSALVPVARGVRRRDEFEVLGLLPAILVVLLVLAVTFGGAPLI
jgi:hypothetical protein